MNLFCLLLLIFLSTSNALQHEVLFTNPTCNTPKKPITYCTEDDYSYNAQKTEGVFQSYVKTLFSEPFNKVVVSYLSYSNQDLTEAYKELLVLHKPQFTLILDDPFEDQPDDIRMHLRSPLGFKDFHRQPTSEHLTHKNGTPIKALKEAYELLKFAHENNIEPSPVLLLRGQTKGSGFSHMKITYLESHHSKQLILGSANLSQGLVLHHENWHFFKGSLNSTFIQAHGCILDQLISNKISFEKTSYEEKAQQCAAIEAEEEYQVYFTPGQGEDALKDLEAKFNASDEIWIAAHRFSNHKIISYIKQALKNQKTVKLLVDDDLFWVQQKKGRYLNSRYEAEYIEELITMGLKVKYVSTNNSDFLLHHNKYLVFIKDQQAQSVFTGAGNLTHSAFTKNFENYFLTKKPEVTRAFQNQYEYIWSLAQSNKELVELTKN